jgi:hypothetical protein
MGAYSETPIPAVPPEFRAVIAGATRDTLTVRALDGRNITVDIGGYQLWDYRLYQNGRYFGMRLSGYEVVGYVLVDRAARKNNVIDTGDAPLFSDDGHWFAVAGLTDADQGNFEGIGLWEVGPTSSTRRFFTNAVPLSSDWRTEHWVGNCVAFSAFTTWGTDTTSDPRARDLRSASITACGRSPASRCSSHSRTRLATSQSDLDHQWQLSTHCGHQARERYTFWCG